MRSVRADMRNAEFLAELRREAEMMRYHPENDAIDDWIEAAIDWDDFGEYRDDFGEEP